MTDDILQPAEKFHGTHSIPKEFWTIKSTDTDAMKARRKVKRANHERNAILHAAWNQYENAGGPRPSDPRPIGGKRYFDKHGKRRVSSSKRT